MPVSCKVEDCINSKLLPPGSRIYYSGNASTPQQLLRQLGADPSIRDVELCGILPLGERESLDELFSAATTDRITHRVIFNSRHTRTLTNEGGAFYHPYHLSDIPWTLRKHYRPNVVLLQVAGPDPGGNFSLGTTVEAILAAIETARESGGTVIAERNAQMPFVLGTTVPENSVDYLVDVDYPLPHTPVHAPEDDDRRIGGMIAERYIGDGATLQFGIGRVPEAVTDAILEKGVKNLSIHTELFADAMRKLVQSGAVTNKLDANEGEDFSVSSIFLADSPEGYQWLHFNSSVQSRPCDYTNNVLSIARQPKMISVNAAIGVDLHGNVWADSLQARRIYSGVGGQADFIRGSRLSKGGVAVIALRSRTRTGLPKIVDKCPEGITTTAIASDQVVLVTENGVFEPWGLSVGERALAIAHLADEAQREHLLKTMVDGGDFHEVRRTPKAPPKGFIPA